jgi:hypothetical protein
MKPFVQGSKLAHSKDVGFLVHRRRRFGLWEVEKDAILQFADAVVGTEQKLSLYWRMTFSSQVRRFVDTDEYFVVFFLSLCPVF